MEAQAHIRELQAKLGHIRLSCDEARIVTLHAETEKLSAQALLQEGRAAHQTTCEQLRQARAANAAMEEKLRAWRTAKRTADLTVLAPASVGGALASAPPTLHSSSN